MVTHLAAKVVNCHAGTFQQQWNCGWNDHHSMAYRVGYGFGLGTIPALVLLALVLLAARVARR